MYPFKKINSLFLRDRERQSASRDGQRHRIWSRLEALGSKLSAQNPTQGSNSPTAISWPESKSEAQPTEPPRHPKNLASFVWVTERERACICTQMRERQRERQGIPSSLHSVSTEPKVGLDLMKLWDHDLKQNQEWDTQSTEPPRCHALIILMIQITYCKFEYVYFLNIVLVPITRFSP